MSNSTASPPSKPDNGNQKRESKISAKHIFDLDGGDLEWDDENFELSATIIPSNERMLLKTTKEHANE
jgi:hypothetical protein